MKIEHSRMVNYRVCLAMDNFMQAHGLFKHRTTMKKFYAKGERLFNPERPVSSEPNRLVAIVVKFDQYIRQYPVGRFVIIAGELTRVTLKPVIIELLRSGRLCASRRRPHHRRRQGCSCQNQGSLEKITSSHGIGVAQGGRDTQARLATQSKLSRGS